MLTSISLHLRAALIGCLAQLPFGIIAAYGTMTIKIRLD
jgi:hypothetical protein